MVLYDSIASKGRGLSEVKSVIKNLFIEIKGIEMMKKHTRRPVIAEVENLSSLTKESVKRAVFMRKMMLSEEDPAKVSGGIDGPQRDILISAIIF